MMRIVGWGRGKEKIGRKKSGEIDYKRRRRRRRSI